MQLSNNHCKKGKEGGKKEKDEDEHVSVDIEKGWKGRPGEAREGGVGVGWGGLETTYTRIFAHTEHRRFHSSHTRTHSLFFFFSSHKIDRSRPAHTAGGRQTGIECLDRPPAPIQPINQSIKVIGIYKNFFFFEFPFAPSKHGSKRAVASQHARTQAGQQAQPSKGGGA